MSNRELSHEAPSLPNSGTDDNLTTQRNPRPATFSSMPDEIILVIFGFVLDGTPPFVTTGPCCAPPQSRPNPEYVRNCYQTCRQFRRVAAELLFTHVPVRRLPSSIERLEKICADPAFCMNTRVVEIDVVLYKQTGNKESFASFIRTQRDRLQRCHAIPFPPSDLQAQVAEVAKLRILESWKRLALQARTDLSELPPDQPDFTQQQLLLWMWRRYRQIFREQGILLSNNDFTRRVAAAIARMPSLKELRFSDGYRDDHLPGLENTPRLEIMVDREGNLDENALMEGAADYSYSTSIEQDDGFYYRQGDVTPYNVLVETPIAAHQAGVRFNKVDIRFWNYIDLTMFAKQSETRAALSLAFGQVHSFFLASQCLDSFEKWGRCGVPQDVVPCDSQPPWYAERASLHLDLGRIRYNPWCPGDVWP